MSRVMATPCCAPLPFPGRTRRCSTTCGALIDRVASILSSRHSECVGSRVEDLQLASKRIVHLARPEVSSLLDGKAGPIQKICKRTFRLSDVVSTDEGLSSSSPLVRRLRGCPEVLAQCQADVKDICQVLRSEHGTMRASVTLQSLHGTMCPRVHADYVHVRAICSYLGPGTDYFPCEAVLMHDTRVVGADESAVQCTPTGDVLYLKGHLDRAGPPAAHRSPEYGGVRLLLVVQSAKDSPDVEDEE